MGTWTLFLIATTIVLGAGTAIPILWARRRRWSALGITRGPSLSVQRCTDPQERICGILMVNNGTVDVCVDRIQYRVDREAIAGPTSRVGVIAVESAGLPASKVRVCTPEPGTVLASGEMAWLISVAPATLGKAERREVCAGLDRLDIEAIYFPARAPWDAVNEARRARLAPASAGSHDNHTPMADGPEQPQADGQPHLAAAR